MKTITPIAIVGAILDEESEDPIAYPAAKIISPDETTIDPHTIAGCLIALYAAFEDFIPENIQNEYEKETLRIFKKLFKIRHDFTDTEIVSFKGSNEEDSEEDSNDE